MRINPGPAKQLDFDLRPFRDSGQRIINMSGGGDPFLTVARASRRLIGGPTAGEEKACRKERQREKGQNGYSLHGNLPSFVRIRLNAY